MQDINDKINNMHMGKLIHMLSHEMKRNQPIDKVIKADLTIMQKHILKFILLETMHKDLYQKDIEEEFQIRKSTVTGYVQLMEKNGYLTRESVKGSMDTRMESVKVFGIVDITVLAAGSIFLGDVHEPIKGTKNPQKIRPAFHPDYP